MIGRAWTGERLYPTRQEAIADDQEYVAVYDNTERLYSTLGCKTPLDDKKDLGKVPENS